MIKRSKKILKIVIPSIIIIFLVLLYFGILQQSFYTSLATTYTDVSYSSGILTYSTQSDQLSSGVHGARSCVEGECWRGYEAHREWKVGEGQVSSGFYAYLFNVTRASDVRPQDWQDYYTKNITDKNVGCKFKGNVIAKVVGIDPNCLQCTPATDKYVKQDISPSSYDVFGEVVVDSVGGTSQLGCNLNKEGYDKIHFNSVQDIGDQTILIIKGSIEFAVANFIEVYRFQNNTCNVLKIVSEDRKANDYDSLQQCQNNIIVFNQTNNTFQNLSINSTINITITIQNNTLNITQINKTGTLTCVDLGCPKDYICNKTVKVCIYEKSASKIYTITFIIILSLIVISTIFIIIYNLKRKRRRH